MDKTPATRAETQAIQITRVLSGDGSLDLAERVDRLNKWMDTYDDAEKIVWALAMSISVTLANDQQRRIAELEAENTRLRKGLGAAREYHAEECAQPYGLEGNEEYDDEEPCDCGNADQIRAIDAVLGKT